jgi:hypothetical protein
MAICLQVGNQWGVGGAYWPSACKSEINGVWVALTMIWSSENLLRFISGPFGWASV